MRKMSRSNLSDITSTVSHRRDATCLEAYLFLYRLQLKSKLGP